MDPQTATCLRFKALVAKVKTHERLTFARATGSQPTAWRTVDKKSATKNKQEVTPTRLHPNGNTITRKSVSIRFLSMFVWCALAVCLHNACHAFGQWYPDDLSHY